MISYTEKDFQRCVFNPLGKKRLSDTNLVDILNDIPDEKKGQEEGLLRYIVAMYDSASPLIKNEPDLEKRKIAAVKIANLVDSDITDDLFSNRLDYVLKAINEYIRSYGQNRLWAMIVSETQRFWEYNYRLMKPVEGERDREILSSLEVKTKLAEELDKMNDRLDSYYKRLYGEDQELMDASKAKRWTPEFIANVSSNRR
jgi:hypothetical protein